MGSKSTSNLVVAYTLKNFNVFFIYYLRCIVDNTEAIRRASRRCHDLSTGNMHFWKWSEWVPKCCTNIVCCQDVWELYFECKKFKETVQTVNFTVFTMCGRELPAEMTYFWWKLKKRKCIFLNDFHQYDLNEVYHEKADVLSIPKML